MKKIATILMLMVVVFVGFPNANAKKINNIPIKWNDATKQQKKVITDLLNDMIYIDSGIFFMGCDAPEAQDIEKPVHREYVEGFYLSKTEVTQELWEAVMGFNPSYFSGENLPVESVTFNDCLIFIKKLNKLTGLNFRLPTEIEREFAARGGNKNSKFKFSGNDNIDLVGWYVENSDGHTHPVATKLPNELGLYDMTGNVEEWIDDFVSPNYDSERNIPRRVIRGGSWKDIPNDSRVTRRDAAAPTYYQNDCGLRLAL